MNHYVLNDEIGQGVFSTVYKGRFRTTTQFYAIYSVDKKRRERVANGVQLLRSLQHPNIIQFFNWYETNHHLWVITEYCTGGDMETVLRSNVTLTMPAIQAFAHDMADGLLYIHSKGVLLNSLHTRNLLMDSAAMLRYHDFGLACPFQEAAARNLVGIPLYMAPELFLGPQPLHSMASDLWSFGCVLYELVTGRPPFIAPDLELLLTEILSTPMPPAGQAPAPLQKLLQGLLEKDPLKRFTWVDVAQSDFWDEPLSLPSDGFPRQVAWEEYEKARNAPSAPLQGWSEAEVREAVFRAMAAAKLNASTQSGEEKKRPTPALDVGKELDFTATVVPQSSGLVNSSTVTTSRDIARSADSGTAISDKSGIRGSPPNGTLSTRRSRVAGLEPPADCPPCRRLSKGRSASGNRAGGGPAVTYAGGRETFKANTSGLSEEMPTDVNLRAFGGGLLRRLTVADFLPHSADKHIRPLSNNSRIECTPEPSFDATALGFTALTAADINSLTGEERTAFFRSLYVALSKIRHGYHHALNVMNYFMPLCSDAEVARLSLNSSVMPLCVRHAGRKNAPAVFRATAALIMGLLVCTTSVITPEVASSSILPDIIELFEKETDAQVKRRLIACIGEFLFYIAVQPDKQRALWNVPSASVRRIYASALDSSDEVLKHYAAKTIENMASTTQKMTLELFAEVQFVEQLLAVFALPSQEGRSEGMRSDAACAAFKLAMLKEELILVVMQFKEVPVSSYAAVVQNSVTHVVQILLTFLNHALMKGLVALGNPFPKLWSQALKESRSRGDSSSQKASLFASSLTVAEAEEIVGNVLFVSEDVLDNLSEAMGQTSAAVYGKALLFVTLIGCAGGSAISHIFSSASIVTFLGRLLRDTDTYVKQCSGVLLAFLAWFVSEKLAHIARRVSSTSTPLHLRAIQQLLNNANLRNDISFQSSVFQSLSTCIEKAMHNTLYGTYENDFNVIADRFVECHETVLRYEEAICLYLAVSYAEMLKRKETSLRFRAIRFLTSALVPISAEEDTTTKESGCAHSAARQVLSATLPNVASLLLETSPIPINTTRLLMVCGEMAQHVLADLVTEQLLVIYMEYVQHSQGDDDMFHPLSFIHLCLLVTPRADIIDFAIGHGLGALSLRTLATAVGERHDQLVEVCCSLLAMLVLHVAKYSSARVMAEFVSCVRKDTIFSVLLPICCDVNSSIAMMEAAAAVVEGFARLSTVARNDITSPLTTVSWVRAFSGALSTPTKQTVAVSLLKALSLSCTSASSDVLQTLGRSTELLSVLAYATTATYARVVASEANKIVRLLSS